MKKSEVLHSLSDINQSNRIIWVIILSCFSYPITSVLFLTFSIPTSFANIVLKGIFLSFYLFCLFTSLTRTKFDLKTNINVWLIILFFSFYSLRLIIDIEIFEIKMAYYSSSYIYIYFFALTLLPVILIVINRKNIDVLKLNRLIFYMLVLANIAYLYYTIVINQGNLEQQFAGRISVRSQSNADLAVINPITVGIFGVCLFVAVLTRLITIRATTTKHIIQIALLILSGINIILSASRGPFLTLVILIIFISFFYVKKLARKKSGILVISFISLLIFILFTYVLAPYFSNKEVFLFQRLGDITYILGNGAKEARNYSYEGAWNDFINNPLFGNHFVGSYDNFYPHNIILEVMMSTGLIGLILFLGFSFRIVKNLRLVINNTLNSQFLQLFMVGLSFVILSLSSGSIITSPECWIFIILLSYAHENSLNSKCSEMLINKSFSVKK